MIAQSNYVSDPRVMRQATALANNKYKVHILGLGWKSDQKKVQNGNITSFKIMNYFSHDSVFIYLFYSMIFFIKVHFKLLYLSLNNRYSLIQIHNMPDHLVFVTYIHKIFGMPVLLDMHDLTVELFKEKWSPRTYKVFKPILILAEKLSSKFANHILTVTPECILILVSRGIPSNKISLILNTADEVNFGYNYLRKYEVINNGLKLFYHGTLAKRFGIHEVIFALPKILMSVPDSKLIIYGRYNYGYKEYLLQIIDELRLQDNVELNDMIPYENISSALSDKHIGVVPYLKTPYMDIALSTKSFEYAANGLPIVSSYLNAMQTVFRPESIAFFKSGNIDELSELIIALCKNPDKRKILSQNAYDDLQKISWNNVKEKYVKVIEDLIN